MVMGNACATHTGRGKIVPYTPASAQAFVLGNVMDQLLCIVIHALPMLLGMSEDSAIEICTGQMIIAGIILVRATHIVTNLPGAMDLSRVSAMRVLSKRIKLVMNVCVVTTGLGWTELSILVFVIINVWDAGDLKTNIVTFALQMQLSIYLGDVNRLPRPYEQ
jgi:hypothetical protein